MATGYVYDPIYLEHDLRGHPENQQRLKAILRVLEQHKMMPRLTPIPAEPITMERLERCHDRRYVEQVQRLAQRGGGHLDMDTYVRSASYDAALMAAGGVVAATRAVLDAGSARIANAFALVRPPGHHALRGRGMGFCLFNNVAVAARYALTERGLDRVLIVDFDVHHGNGTQDEFDTDPGVMYISTHQYPHYPGTGHWREIGRGDGKGSIVNVPLHGGVGDAGFPRIFDEIIGPAAWRFQPQLILVSAGYDAHWDDPLAHMYLSVGGYTAIARALKKLAEELCDGRLVFTLEGGYHLEALSYSVLNTVALLLGDDDWELVDPLGPSPHDEQSTDAIIAQVRQVHGLARG
ncbi:MAG: histone deacetylase [Anaerolineae bacterium]|jgi:acetoin utilization deacetylase AcuC-like enzyme